jgi:hypothetical protein
MNKARALLSEAQRFLALVSDDDRLYSEFPRESRFIADTFRDYEDYFRYEWHGTNGRERLLNARYLAIAADLRIATVILRGAVRYGNTMTIEVKRAEIRQAVRQLADLIRNGITDASDGTEPMMDMGKALGLEDIH